MAKRKSARKSKAKTRKRVVRKSSARAFKAGEEFEGKKLDKLRSQEDKLQEQLDQLSSSRRSLEGTTAHAVTQIINTHGIDNVKNVIKCPEDTSCVATVVFKGRQVDQDDLNTITDRGYRIKSIASKAGAVHVTFED